ncbi:MAG: TonB-dependent receptor [Bacteroidetes bacterium]|nr:MAG: TonB-dependent receptor [Bacteroidota bacterium]
MKRLLLLAGLLFCSALLWAQSTISGTVTSDGIPLIGVTVQAKGTAIGITTDVNGRFALRVPDGTEALVVSYVGYKTQEVPLSGASNLNIELEEDREMLNEVVVVGSRAAGRTKLESAVPVDVLDVKELTTVSPQTNVNQMLNYVAPSFSSNTQTISDGTDHLDPASLRGLGPDQVLVLINGKRRHTSSLVNINGTFGRGNVGTDMNALPAGAIDRIEVLRDGAAAQYGSDAIAGVINIIMKQDVNQLTANVTTGAYASEGSNFFTGGLDGEHADLSLNYGLPLGREGGFINFTGNFESRGWTSRMKELTGQIYSIYNGAERLASQAGIDVSRWDVDDVRNYALQLNYLSSDQISAIQNADDATLQSTSSPLLGDVSEAELAARGLERTDFNMRVGQSHLRGGRFFVNMNLPINDKAEFYAFGGLSSRDGLATGFYRLPHQNRTYSPAYPNGFLPEIHTDILDKSMAVGIRGNLKGWDADFSNTFGTNSFGYNVRNSNNATLQNATPFEFDAGGFSFLQNTTNFDLRRFYKTVLHGLNFATGAEFRVENYSIRAGNEDSWASYDINGEVVTPTTPGDELVTDFFGRGRPGGAQVFPGFRPSNELNEFRNSVAVYADAELDLTENFLVSGALRFENYSDFGSTFNYKAAARYKFNANWSIRAAASSGFRAPSLHQIYFNSTSTLFIDGIPYEVGTFSNNSRIARILGIPKLNEETSQSLSAGITGRIPDAALTLSVDVFQVDINDRVILTGTFDPSDGKTPDQQAELESLFARANTESATFFANAIDTRTKGLDVVLTHTWRFNNSNRLNTSLAGTFSKTEQVGDVNTSRELEGLEDVYFDETSRIFLEQAVPRTKVNLSFNLTLGKLNVFLRNVYFGEVTEATNNVANQQTFSGKTITDLSLGYLLQKNTRLTIGANNLLDVYPDENLPGNQGAGQFLYSRRSQQFGFQGRYIFGRLSFTF